MCSSLPLKIYDIAKDAIQAAGKCYDFIRKYQQQSQQHDAAIQTFVSSFTPRAKGFRTLIGSWPGNEGTPVEEDENAATALAAHISGKLGLREDAITLMNNPVMLASELKGTASNVGLLGGPSGNPVCRAALGFEGEFRNELSPDKECPLWNEGVLRYYSISNLRDFSSAEVCAAFDAYLEETRVRNSRTPGLIWGIAEFGGRTPRIVKTDLEWTLLITRMPNFFSMDSTERVSSQGLMIIDGVHREATEAFRLLFEPAYVEELEKINRRVKDSTVFQVPLIVKMDACGKVVGIRVDEGRCPIHVWGRDDRGIRWAAYQYTAQKLADVFRALKTQ